MDHTRFVCPKNRTWIEEHPLQAFEQVNRTSNYAQSLMAKQNYIKALPYLKTTFEILEIIFDLRIESPQLTNKLTSVAIMLAETYYQTNQVEKANITLMRLHKKIQAAIDAENNYASKMIFYKHCASSLLQASDEICSCARVELCSERAKGELKNSVTMALH